MSAKDDFEVSTVSERGVTTIPEKMRDKLGRYIKWTPLQGGGVKVEKVTVLALLAMAFFILPAQVSAHGQEAVPAEQPVITQPVTQGPSPLQTVESITLAGDAAHFPLRVEFTYPSGINPIWNVSKGSVFSVYSEQSTVGVGGITTKTWSTGMADTFRIRFGEHYPAPTDQIAIVRVFTNSTNPNTVPDWIIPINGNSFERELVLITSPTPHQPTPEELAAPVLTRLDSLQQTANIIDQRGQAQDISFGLLVQVLQGSVGFFILAIVIVVALIFVILKLYVMIKNKVTPKLTTIRSTEK
jgi:hypothetical protein